MTTRNLLHGIDELVFRQYLPPAAQLNFGLCVQRILAALRESGVNPRDASNSNSRIVWLRLGDFDLRIVPSGRFVEAHARSKALHRRPHRTFVRMIAALNVAFSACSPAVPGLCPEPRLVSIALHADIVGWPFSRATVARLVNNTHRPPDHHERGRTYTGASFGDFAGLYVKTVEIVRHPSKAWIAEDWAANGYRPGDGPVVRVEFTFGPRELRRWGAGDPDALWSQALDHLWLPRRPRGSTASEEQRWRWPEDPLWRRLRELNFVPPWTPSEPPTVSTPPPPTGDHIDRRLVGVFRASLRDLARRYRVRADTALGLVAGVLEAVERGDAKFVARLLDEIRRTDADEDGEPDAPFAAQPTGT